MKTKLGKLFLVLFSLLGFASCEDNSNKIFTVEYEENEYVRFSGPATVNYGETLYCSITYLSIEDFDYSEMKIYANDVEVELQDGTFSVPKVKKNRLSEI